MDHMGGYFNPLKLVERIPEGMAISRLRDRLVGIIADYRTQTSLREGCTAILRSDCLVLAQARPPVPCVPYCLYCSTILPPTFFVEASLQRLVCIMEELKSLRSRCSDCTKAYGNQNCRGVDAEAVLQQL